MPTAIARQARAASRARWDDSTPNSAYSRLRGSAITAKGSSATCSRSSSAPEWKTTTSRIPAASISACRRTIERRCRWQMGQPHEPAELEVHEVLGVRHGDGCTVRDGGQGAGTDDGTGVELH